LVKKRLKIYPFSSTATSPGGLERPGSKWEGEKAPLVGSGFLAPSAWPSADPSLFLAHEPF
jgi:hypothetical protein